jgi:hypothetical protein
MRSLIEPAMAALAAAAMVAMAQDDPPQVCEHAGLGATAPADVEGARRTLSELERSIKLRVEAAKPPRLPALPRCAAEATRRERRADLPKTLEGRAIRIDSAEGASEDLLKALGVRCWPTEVRFLPGGEIEWVER